MRQPDQREHKTSGTPLTAWLPVVAAVAIMATGCLSTFLVLQLDELLKGKVVEHREAVSWGPQPGRT